MPRSGAGVWNQSEAGVWNRSETGVWNRSEAGVWNRVSAVVVFAVAVLVISGVGLAGAGFAETERSPDGEVSHGGDETNDPGGDLEVHYINVGDADATLVVAPSNETMLIDSGDWHDDGETVVEYLEAQGIERLDYLVATHAHANNVGGHAAVIEHYEEEGEGIGEVWDTGVPHDTATYENYLDAVEAYDAEFVEAHEGDEIPLEGVNVTLYNPPEESDRPDDLHYNSMVILVEFDDVSFLFTGDAEEDAEARLVAEYGEDLDADVYKVGQHGSQSSSTAQFLDVVDPRLSVISSNYDSQYDHPHEETLDRLADHDSEVYWTGTHGTTVVVTDGSELTVKTQHEAPTDPTELRDGDEATADPTDPVEERERIPVATPRVLSAPPGIPIAGAVAT